MDETNENYYNVSFELKYFYSAFVIPTAIILTH